MFHPGRSGRNHLRGLARASGVAEARVDELLELVALTDAADRRAGGYSLGMRQRLGLAAALLGDPEVLVLDEPANGLDPQGIRWLRDFLRTLAGEGRAVLVSSHVLAEVAQTADEVVVIAHGKSVAQAPLAELTARSGGGMRVAGPDAGRLAEALRADGAEVHTDGERAIVVRGRSGEEIGRVIAAGRDRHLRARAGRLVARGDLLRAHRRRGRAVVSHALSAELFKLRTTRTSWAVILGAIGLVVLISVIAAATGSFAATDDAGEDLLQISGLVQLFALVIGILAVATEFRHGTITPSLLAVPDRTRLVLAKLITALIAGALLGLAASALCAVITLPILSARDAGTGSDSTEIINLIVGNTAACALFAALGVGLGALIRNQVGAIIGALGYLFVVEPLLGVIPGFSDFVQKWFPGGASSEVAGTSGLDDPLGQLPAGIVLAAYAAVFLVAGIVMIRRRDVSA